MDVEFMDLWPVIWLQVKMLSRRGFVHYENADSVPEPEPAEITRGGPHSDRLLHNWPLFAAHGARS